MPHNIPNKINSSNIILSNNNNMLLGLTDCSDSIYINLEKFIIISDISYILFSII